MPTPTSQSDAQATAAGTRLSPGHLVLALATAAFAFMTWISWRRWPDVLIDFGHQLYVAWRIAEGDLLYRDLFYAYGPVSSYLNGFLFHLFGTGMMTLAVFNLGLIAALAWLIYALFLRLGDVVSAGAAVLVFLLVFAFGHFELIGSYNFVMPYVYDLTHGVFLSLTGLYAFMRFLEFHNPRWLAAAGCATGLVFLTKSEVFVALAPALLAGVVIAMREKSGHPPLGPRFFAAFAAGLALPLLLVFAWVSARYSFQDGGNFLLQPWAYMFNSDLRNFPLYTSMIGLDTPGLNFSRMLLQATVFLGGIVALLAIRSRLPAERGRAAPLALAGLAALGCFALQDVVNWVNLLRPVPLLVLGLLVWVGASVLKGGQPPEEARRRLLLLVVSVFAFILMGKMILRVHVFHYGFALALPGTLVVLHGCLNEVPRQSAMKNPLSLYRLPLLVLVTFMVMMLLSRTLEHYSQKTEPVGSGRDLIYEHTAIPVARAVYMQIGMRRLEAMMKPGDTLWTLPDAPMVNYLMRRKSPVREYAYNPATWLLLGEAPLLAQLHANPPPYILFVHRHFFSLDIPFFGQDYAQETFAWIQQNYTMAGHWGPPPFGITSFGVTLLKRAR